jgi:mRNA-degrading endonuclease RelE of RelBE toxin-antitoxin system
MAALPKDLQLDLLTEFQLIPHNFDNMNQEHFGSLSREGRKLFRYRAKDYRIYFEPHPKGVLIHRVLHKNTLRDFLFRSNLPMTEEDQTLGETGAFWQLIEEGEKSHTSTLA